MKTKHIIILIIAVTVVTVIYLNRYRIKHLYLKYMQVYKDADIQLAFDNNKKYFSKDILQNAERIFRLETNHFTSGGLKATNGAGMEATTYSYPYGWNSLKPFWDMNEKYKPIFAVSLKEAVQKDVEAAGQKTGLMKKFIVFPSLEAGIFAVAARLQRLKNNPGAYFANDPKLSDLYASKINAISVQFTR